MKCCGKGGAGGARWNGRVGPYSTVASPVYMFAAGVYAGGGSASSSEAPPSAAERLSTGDGALRGSLASFKGASLLVDAGNCGVVARAELGNGPAEGPAPVGFGDAVGVRNGLWLLRFTSVAMNGAAVVAVVGAKVKDR